MAGGGAAPGHGPVPEGRAPEDRAPGRTPPAGAPPRSTAAQGIPASAPGAVSRSEGIPQQARPTGTGRLAAPGIRRAGTPRTSGAPGAGRAAAPAADALAAPEPSAVAQAVGVGNLLRCWVREAGLAVPDGGMLRVPLPASGTALVVPVRYRSPTGRHRFGPARPEGAPESAPPVDPVTLAALLARETGGGGDLVTRVADSVRRTAAFVRDRRADPADHPDLFLAAEQALVLGHPLHPTPKSREGLTDAEARAYSPELRGSFALRWIAVAPSLLAADSAWTERGRTVTADRLTARLMGPGAPLPEGHAALPLHPWQFREIRRRPETAALLDAGLLRDLGVRGDPWHPTSSLRTVHRTGAPAMLKLSLALQITNSRRENLRKELHRGVEVHRLLRTGLSRRWQAAHPGFDIVRDPAWLAVDGPDGGPVRGLDVVVRHNPFGPWDDVACVAGLVAPRVPPPTGGPGGPATPSDDLPADGAPAGSRPSSRLAEIVACLALRTRRPRGAVAAEWFLRYLEHVVRPVLWLDAEAGVALEAHQQNTLVVLGAEGWPTGGRYRDNQGYYFRASRHTELDARLPGIGERSDTFVSDEVADERFAYYLAINNVFGLIGAFGSQGLADERLLLAAFRRFLGTLATGPARLRTPLPARLLDSPRLRCKANLMTRLHGLDELVGPVDTQSVYVTIANPLHAG
ncbi:IucA/IucC family protein [Streptomyces sp. SHP 1-2]|uniref:IucA/IucC family protein n=1 Tax=Streptomyces sp. SHP 1-2 TaxID=2769489 RepID=UPI0022382CB0|nr:IucA/IucC family protein [Streptomyces sp. SHP 1-2]